MDMEKPWNIEIRHDGGISGTLLRATPIYNVEIPKGFKTDGGSVPRIFWWIASPWTGGLPAFLVHDYRYQTTVSNVLRKAADKELLNNLKACDFNIFRRAAIYTAVRLFGGFYFNKANYIFREG